VRKAEFQEPGKPLDIQERNRPVIAALYDEEPVLRLRDDFEFDPNKEAYVQRQGARPLAKTKHGKTKIAQWEKSKTEKEAEGERAHFYAQLIQQAHKYPVVLGIRLYFRLTDPTPQVVCVCGIRQFLGK
jgi:hypothetical protein